MTIVSTQLEPLLNELHEINRQFLDAATPLRTREYLDQEARDQLGARLREALARWESITSKIHQVLEHDGASGAVS